MTWPHYSAPFSRPFSKSSWPLSFVASTAPSSGPSRTPQPNFRALSKLAILTFCGAVLTSCGTQTEIVYASAARYPEELDGFMRVATDEEVRVNVAGTDAVAERNVAGYVLLAPADAAQLVRNTADLIEMRKAK